MLIKKICYVLAMYRKYNSLGNYISVKEPMTKEIIVSLKIINKTFMSLIQIFHKALKKKVF